MNRIQKMSLMTVVCTGIGFVLSVLTVTILYFKSGFPSAWAGLAFMSISGFSGLGSVIFKKDPGAVQADERDRMILLQSTRSGFVSSYLVFGGLAMGVWCYAGPDKMINVNTLPLIWMAAFITAFFVQSLTTLILYGRGK
jgi:hypothetical protein